MRYLLFTVLGALAVLAVGMSYAPASEAYGKVFHNNTQADNHDSCLNPKENLDNKSVGTGDELVLTVDDQDEIKKARIAFSKRIGIPDEQIIPFDVIQIFKSGDVYTFDIFAKSVASPDEPCEVATFPLDEIEFDLWLQAGDLQSVGTADVGRLGHEPKQSVDTTVNFV